MRPHATLIAEVTVWTSLAVLALVAWVVAVVWAIRTWREDDAAPAQGRMAAPRERLDLNRASADELRALSGIGPVLSRRIVEERERLGGFARVDDLLGVKGITKERLEQLRAFVTAARRAGAAESVGTGTHGTESER